MAKKKVKKNGSSGLKPFYLLLALVAIAGGAGLAYTVLSDRGAAATTPVDLAALDDRALVELARPETMGSEEAPVRLLVFNDFECPYCSQFALQTKPALKSDFVDDGHLQIVYYDFPLPGRRHSFLVSRAARCAGEHGRFWEYHDLTLSEQSVWAPRQNIVGDLVAYGERIGLDTAEFGACVRSDRYADVVTANSVLGGRLGVQGTPTVYVNGRLVPRWNDYGLLSRTIREELGE